MESFKVVVGDKEVPIVDNQIQKGSTKGFSYATPDFEESIDFDKAVEIWGKETLGEILFSELKRQANNIHKEALCEVTGKKKWREAIEVPLSSEQLDNYRAAYGRMITDWSPKGLSTKQLRADIADLMETLASIKPVTTIINGIKVPDVNAPETQRFYKIAERLQLKQQALDNKSNKSDDDGDSAEAPAEAVAA